MTERQVWFHETLHKIDNKFAHQEHFAFHFGFQMGVEVSKHKTIEKWEFLLNKMKARKDINMSAEIALLESLIEYHYHLGDADIGQTTIPPQAGVEK